jgi:hypothetical protein
LNEPGGLDGLHARASEPERIKHLRIADEISNLTFILLQNESGCSIACPKVRKQRVREWLTPARLCGRRFDDGRREKGMRLDFVKRIGGMGLELGLGVLLLGIVLAAWNSADSRAATSSARAARRSASPVSATLAAQQGTVCLQDESNGNFLTFESTGAYTFTSCIGGVTLSGTGVLKSKGLVITLEDVKPDRRVTATVDQALRQGKAAAQTFVPSRSFTIRDKNIDNNTCACGGGPKQ